VTETASIAEAVRLLDLQKHAHVRDGAPDVRLRRDRLSRLAGLLKANADRFAEAISADFGHRSRMETALLEVGVTLSSIRYTRARLADWMAPSRRDVEPTFWPGSAHVRREPLGVVGVLSPWNYPLQLVFSPLVDIFAGGNRALIKPSEHTPAFSACLERVIRESFTEEEAGVITGGPEVAEAFSRLPFDHLLFTGSTAVGRKVARAAAEGLVPVTLELGGKSPALVCPSADLTKAAVSIAYGKFVNAGQTCIAPDYVLAPRGRVAEIAQAIHGEAERLYPGLGEDYSSLIHDRAFDRLQSAVEEAEQAGARVLRHSSPSDRGRRVFAPVVITDVPGDCRLMQEEIFGPVLPVIGYDSLHEAVSRVRAGDHPLALYAFSQDEAEIDAVLEGTQSGGVTLNGTLMHIAQDSLPFGGVGSSGMGAYHGRAGFERFTHARSVFRVGFFNPSSLISPPYGQTARRLARFLTR
jgi:coniferyl-aldehyde dehydrogenase